MAESTLQHDTNTPPTVTKGHGTGSLGPSDSSDSGSDIQGGAAADLGDANLDSDSDRNGTGERAAVGHDAAVPADTRLRDERGNIVDGETLGDEEDSRDSDATR